MSEVERGILRQFAVELKRDVIPSEVLPHLLCFTDDDCEQILREEDRKGPRAAVTTLLDRLKKRLKQGAFKEFSTALGEEGCPHLQELLENAFGESCQPKPEHNNPTQDTSKSQSSSLKTPTTETVNSLNPSTPENKQSKKPKSNKKLTPKNGRIPKENTTSPPESKTQTKVKTADTSNSQPTDTTDANPPYVKLVKTPRNTQSKKSGVSQKVRKCPPETKNNEDSRKEISSNNNIDTQPPTDPTEPEETHLTRNSTTSYDTLVCYAKENRDIARELKKFLETECSLQVCIDFQNFMPGKATTDNITESINSSRSIIFLLSSKFLKKHWAQYELKHAVYNINESIKDGKHKTIIPVLLEKCQVPDELKIYTPIKMEGSGSRKDSWKKLAAAISGTSYNDDNDTGSGNSCNEDGDHGNHNSEDNGNGEENDGESSDDDAGNNEGTIAVSDNHSGDDDDDDDGDGDDSCDEDVNDNDLDQDGEDTVHGSNEAESNDDDDDSSSSSDNDDDIEGDKDGSENSSHDSDNDDNPNCDGDDVAGNHSNDAGDLVGSSHSNCDDEGSDDVEGSNSAEVDTNNTVVHGNAGGDSAGVNNTNDKSKDGYGTGKIDSL